MAKKNTFYSNLPVEVTKGGTGDTSFTAYTVITGGPINTDDPLQNVSSAGSAAEVQALTSQGIWMLPKWQGLPTFFEPLASDPSSPSAGDTWYNTTEKEFKGAVEGTGVCTGSGPWTIVADTLLNMQFGGGAGTSSEAIIFCGSGPYAVWQSLNNTSYYNSGTDSWTAKSTLNYYHWNLAGCGNDWQDALAVAGFAGPTNNWGNLDSVVSERYTGGSDTWSMIANYLVFTHGLRGAGEAGSAIILGGSDPARFPTGLVFLKTVCKYDGIGDSWSYRSNTNQYRYAVGACGQTASVLVAGGLYGYGTYPYYTNYYSSATTEMYDDAANSWTAQADTNISHVYPSASGVSESALIYGGETLSYPAPATQLPAGIYTTERFNSTLNAWTLADDQNIYHSRAQGSLASTSCDALVGSGMEYNPSYPAASTNSIKSEIYGNGTAPVQIVTFDTV